MADYTLSNCGTIDECKEIWCSSPDLEDAMFFISNILGSGKLILFLIVRISGNDVSRTGSRRQSAMGSGMLTVHCQVPKLRNVEEVVYLADLPEPR
jgi:hypothetical protein